MITKIVIFITITVMVLGTLFLGLRKESNVMIQKQANADNICVVPDEVLRKTLSSEQYAVAVKGGTERPFANAYWNNHAEGIYVDVIDGTPLFSSQSKYDSGTGWPSFWEPLDKNALELLEDRSFGMIRVEVRSKSSGAHLGHVFTDGPEPTGLRYCMNSAALRFIPKEELEAAGLGRFKNMFEK
ncbi:peptide-methionine (R)-S-oxide reductase MsrB [Gracilinema caldarium]|uniref:peptide-methionine (R)-S-oxide reductase MsrB n=1 Tax=Gracilinema caldarium TaxID=215591 RepID=UPI0026E92C13|nr:peptide-methionine (R)-S-oxide reductase MsrB [Gracilinema caldarium]